MLARSMLARSLLALVLSSHSALALAFPPCPLEPVVIRHADGTAPTGGDELEWSLEPSPVPEPRPVMDGYQTETSFETQNTEEGGDAPPATAPWALMHAYIVGPSKYTPLLNVGDPSKPGECNRVTSTLPLAEGHDSDGSLRMAPRYAPQAVLGLLELPDYVASAPINLRTVYRLPIEIANTPLAAPGEWVDMVQIEVADAEHSGQLAGVLRLRTLRDAHGQRLRLILSGREPLDADNPSPDVVLGEWIASENGGNYSMLLTWRQHRTSVELGTHPTGESATATLELRKGDGTVWVAREFPNGFLHTLQFGVLDYNSAQRQEIGAKIVLGRLSLMNE